MDVDLPAAVLDAMRAHAREAYPEECCGFLIGKDEGPRRLVEAGRRAKNVHPEMREVRYTIDPREVLALERELRGRATGIVGFYHSHPEHPARPSEFDRSRAWPWYVYVVLALDAQGVGDVTAWTFDDVAGEFRPVSVVGK